MSPSTRDAATLTELCNSENIPEVEIVTLVEERIPRYRLRADTLTSFEGYENADWFIPFPALKEDQEKPPPFSPELIEATLAYFVLCGHRVSQMTKAYNDIDAVTQLLEEKEKDLELAAKIGQQLLERNKQVEERLTQLEGEVQVANDTITQLRHDLQLKTELLHIYSNDFDESGSEAGTPSGMRHLGVELLQTKTTALEKENTELRGELLQLKESTETAEGREKDLVDNVVFELTDANQTIRSLSDELAARVDEHMKNQEEVTGLLAQLVDSQSRAKRLAQENEELQSFMAASKEAQSELALELADLKDKYAQLQAMYHDAQQLIRRREKQSASNRSSYLGGLMGQPDSLASELELSLSSMGSNDSGLSPAVGITPFPALQRSTAPSMVSSCGGYRSAFDTVRAAQRGGPPTAAATLTAAAGPGSYPGLRPTSLPLGGAAVSASLATCSAVSSAVPAGGVRMSSRPWPGGSTDAPAGGGGDSGAWMQDNASQISDSECSIEMDDTSDMEYPGLPRGIPGVPGSPDLRAALQRLAPSDLSKLGSDGMRTPESIMSLGSSRGSLNSSGGAGWRLPEKLQIVKPLEGSATLHHWSRLATPHLGGLLDPRPGVSSRGERPLQPDSDTSDWSGAEEPPPPRPQLPAMSYKPLHGSGSVFTLTNSTVLHPDDAAMPTSSLQGGQMSTLPLSVSSGGGATSTPVSAPRRASTSTYTFSTHLGLARALHERGVTPSLCGSPAVSPTSTPANSPADSRAGSPAPEVQQPALIQGLMDVGKLGARLLRRTFISAEDAPRAPSYSRNQEPQPAPESESEADTSDSEAAGGGPGRRQLGRRLRQQMSVLERLQRLGLQGILAADGAPVPALSAARRGGSISRGQLGVPATPGSGALQGRLAMLGTVPRRPTGRGRRSSGAVGTLGVHSAGRKGGFS